MSSRVFFVSRLKFKSFLTAIFLVIAVGVLSAEVQQDRSTQPNAKQRATVTSSQLQKAISFAQQGDMNRYHEVLQGAIQAEPNSSLLRAQLGYIRKDTGWITIEETWDQQKTKSGWKEYARLRDNVQTTVESQMELATFCKKTGLKEQERAHLYAVLELEPNNEAARSRLGYQRVGDDWMFPRDIEIAKKQAIAIAKAYREQHVKLEDLFAKLNVGRLNTHEVVAKLLEDADLAIIPTWELISANGSEKGALAIIEALKNVPGSEASLALARQAIVGQTKGVQQFAIESLRSRDQYSYVPVLIRELRGPWMSSVQVASVPGRRLFIRQIFFADEQDKQQMAIFDQTLRLHGNPFFAQANANFQAASLTASRDLIAGEVNKPIEAKNKMVMDVLAGATGESKFESPQDWWSWWNEKNYRYAVDKTVVAQIAAATDDIEGIQSSETPTIYTEYLPIDYKPPGLRSCLPAGTKIWTNTGKVAIDRIKIGDVVLSQDMRTGELIYKPVLKTTIREPNPLIMIHHENEVIRSTQGHPFWVVGKGWIRASDLKGGMLLHTTKGPCAIVDVQQEEMLVKTFNLVVEDCHNYFVGDRGILSHDVIDRTETGVIVPGLVKKLADVTKNATTK